MHQKNEPRFCNKIQCDKVDCIYHPCRQPWDIPCRVANRELEEDALCRKSASSVKK